MLGGGRLGSRNHDGSTDLLLSFEPYDTFLTLLFKEAYLFIICLFYTRICMYAQRAAMASEFRISL